VGLAPFSNGGQIPSAIGGQHRVLELVRVRSSDEQRWLRRPLGG
jgi:hypothetical protein